MDDDRARRLVARVHGVRHLAGLAPGTAIAYRAILDYGDGTVTSADRSVTVAPAPMDTAVVHYGRADEATTDWGVHLFGDAIDHAVATDWNAPLQRTGVDDFGAVFEIPLKDDTKAVSFIVHKPGGDAVPTTREPGGDRSFVPIRHPEIWLVAGDPGGVHSRSPGELRGGERRTAEARAVSRVIVVGSINVDLVVSLERLPAPGETVTGGRFSRHGGGKGANQATAAARLGAAVTMVGAVGDDDLGEEALALLREEGIDVERRRAARRASRPASR